MASIFHPTGEFGKEPDEDLEGLLEVDERLVEDLEGVVPREAGELPWESEDLLSASEDMLWEVEADV